MRMRARNPKTTKTTFTTFTTFTTATSKPPPKTKMLKSTLIFRKRKISRTFAPEISKRAAISF